MAIQSDLLPASVQKRRFIISALKCWGVVWGLIALAVFYACLEKSRLMTHLATSAARVEAEAGPLRKIRSGERRMRKQIADIQQRESWLTESDSGQTLQLLGIISRAASDNRGRISVETLKVQEIERAVGPAKPEPAKRTKKSELKTVVETKMQLELHGIAVDDLAVASFVSILREASVFESVELKSTLSEMVNNHETRKYELSCIY